MPRGFKRDREATLAAAFLDPRSFVSLPTIACQPERGRIAHLVLYGKKDVGAMRERVFAGKPNCFFCGRPCTKRDDMHHKHNKPSERCWCYENLFFSHHWNCHLPHHFLPKSKQEARA